MRFSSDTIKIKLKQSIDLFIVFLIFLPFIAFADQICDPGVIPTTPNNRFHNIGDGTVTDLHTELMWQRCSIGQSGVDCSTGRTVGVTWDLALQEAINLNKLGGFAGYNDWRLPNVKELRSLVERACYGPAINLTVFPNSIGSFYWSSSPDVSFSDKAWYVSFHTGVSKAIFRHYDYNVRLVRDGTP